MSGARSLLAAFIVSLALLGCGSTASAFSRSSKRTCVVLSVGGFKGVAHAGALAAIRAHGIKVDCVVGNSMGALVGALYSTAPDQDASIRLKEYLAAYVQATKDEVAANAGFGALVGAVLTGGIGGLLVGGAAGAVSVNRLEHVRAVEVLRRVVQHATIESAPIRFATFYARRAADGLETVAATSGDISEAVGRSMSNPFIFTDVDVREGASDGVDPGADRVAATPVEDACNLFPDARLIAINVTGQNAFYSAGMKCPVLEVKVQPVKMLDPDDVARGGVGFDELVRAGRDATDAALVRSGI